MTYDDFLKRVRETPRDWYFVLGRIRRGTSEYQCPISACVNMDCGEAELAGRRLGLDIVQIREIMAAADMNSDDSDEYIRKDLLKACGL